MSALVASLFAVGVAPAAAAPVMAGDDNKAKPDHESDFLACLGDAVEDHGFTDLGTLNEAVPNINCLAYYGITVGRTADTFDPNSNVTRSQMALFLYRTAGLVGVDLMGGDMMADYGDVSELGEDRQAAIKALARNGIMSGRGGMGNFYPLADITRAEMASALVALLDHTPGAPVHKDKDTGFYELGATADTAMPPNDWFADARASVPRAVDNAISAAYELGITSGVGDGSSFDPGGSVPRRDMATFIARTIAHSNLRPAGLSAQVHDNTKVTVSVRDADFAAVVNQTVDLFRAPVGEAGRAFAADGSCTTRTSTFEAAGTKCEIDGSDASTQTNGNIELTLDSNVSVGDGQTVWVWAGDLGDKVTSGTVLVQLSIDKDAAPAVAATSAALSTDLPEKPDGSDVDRAHFGATVTVTIQLRGTSGGETVDAVPPAGEDPPKYRVVVKTHNTPPNNDGTVPSPADANRLGQATHEVTIGADGSGTFTVTAADTDTRSRGQAHTIVIEATGDPDGSGGTDSTTVVRTIVFSDEAPRVEYVSIEAPSAKAAPSAGGQAANAVVVTARDQFGDPVANAGIVLKTSNAYTGAGDSDGGSTLRDAVLYTGRSGMVRITYSYRGGAYQETLRAGWDGSSPADGIEVVGTVCTQEDRCDETMVNWVFPTELAAPSGPVGVLSLDADNDQVVVDLQTNGAITPTSINYDSNDFFTVTSDGDTGDVIEPMTLAGFEEELAKALKAFADGDGSDPQRPTLSWSSYVHDDSSDIASFILDATAS